MTPNGPGHPYDAGNIPEPTRGPTAPSGASSADLLAAVEREAEVLAERHDGARLDASYWRASAERIADELAAALARIAAVEAKLAQAEQDKADSLPPSGRAAMLDAGTAEICVGTVRAALAASPTPTGPEPATKPKWVRDPGCVERWPECYDGDYNPACCRFPKSCSCLIPATPEPTEETP